MAAAKDDPVSVEDKDNIEALLDDADRLSSTISRPFSGLSTVLARIRAASIAQKKELDATLEVCQQMQKKVDVAEAKTQDILNQVVEKFNEKIKADMPNMLKKAFTEANLAGALLDVVEAENQGMMKAFEAVKADMPNIVEEAFTEAKRKAGGSWHVEEPTEVVCTSAPETATEPMKKKMKYTTTVPMASGKEEMNAIEMIVWNSNAFTPEQKKEIWSRVQEKTTPVGDAVPRLASHADHPAKRSRPSPSASSGASSGAAGGAAGGAASVPGTDIV